MIRVKVVVRFDEGLPGCHISKAGRGRAVGRFVTPQVLGLVGWQIRKIHKPSG